MYTFRSKSFGPEFKNQALSAIQSQIKEYSEMTTDLFGKLVATDTGSEYGMDQVKSHGHRWKDPEQVFQAMIMRLERKMIATRGPGMMTDEEAVKLQAMYKTHPSLFEVLAADAVKGAASCDHWYMFEKVWE